MKKQSILLFILLRLSFNILAQDQTFNISPKESLVITFGSCNKQNKPQPLWKDVVKHQPDFFLFLGDNIYGDTEDMKLLEEKYAAQKSQPDYVALQKQTTILGVWDDHDYGKNDAGKEYPNKKESQQLLLDFFDVPAESLRREREGAYSSYQINWNGRKISILLLDARYHRDPLQKIDKKYTPNKTGSILGTEQWNWLEKELSDTSIDLFIIALGIQFIAEDHNYEKWANFPNERKKLFDLLAARKPQGVLLLSGDRHIAEISSIEWKDLSYPLVDITSSGLTHTWKEASEEYNQHREGDLIAKLNYGILTISTNKDEDLTVNSKIKGQNQEVYLEKIIQFNN
ncbi:hypothetical protein GCM10011506_44650 [Marivirga lumbricoides]|uniref:PhoD-like phosphatase metallophosphatase domain-containing protein n=1 Tax=Marivirga lumbricoides TaxID=1046115 RepID=A0ABQ1N4W2_9BACT|nr:hypothetical protein GCM10011506_44650 [Marivirga lumbricoides]